MTDLSSKSFSPFMDVEYLATNFSSHFHFNSLSPEFYIQVKKLNHWEMYPTEEPVKRLNDFLPSSRTIYFLKKRMYYKAERANQHLIVCEVLGHYFLEHLEELHFRQDQIAKINLQWLTVSGHMNPYDQEEEVYLLKNKQRISVLHLVTQSGLNIYLDLCGPQIDLHNYADKFDIPIVMTDNLENKKPYLPDVNKNINVLLVEESVPITDQDHYREYLELMIKDNEDDVDDRAEYLIEYHERLEKDFSDLIQKNIKEGKIPKLPSESKHFFSSTKKKPNQNKKNKSKKK